WFYANVEITRSVNAQKGKPPRLVEAQAFVAQITDSEISQFRSDAIARCRSQYSTLAADCRRVCGHDYIAAHLDQKITNDALAQIVGLSTAHFCVVFKQTEGMSPHRYVLQYRVRRTQQLLASTEMSLAEIADAVGFSN